MLEYIVAELKNTLFGLARLTWITYAFMTSLNMIFP